jgi:hypothetical protein
MGWREALNELEVQDLMSGSHLITRADARNARIVREAVLAGRPPRWDNFPAGTRRYREVAASLRLLSRGGAA